MPYKSKRAQKAYLFRWRKKNKNYMTDYGRKYYDTFCKKERPNAPKNTQ